MDGSSSGGIQRPAEGILTGHEGMRAVNVVYSRMAAHLNTPVMGKRGRSLRCGVDEDVKRCPGQLPCSARARQFRVKGNLCAVGRNRSRSKSESAEDLDGR